MDLIELESYEYSDKKQKSDETKSWRVIKLKTEPNHTWLEITNPQEEI